MFLQSQVRRNVTFSSLAFSISLAHTMIGLKSDSSTKLSCLNGKYKMVLTVIFMTILRSLHFLISIQETLISSRELKRGLYAYLGVVTTPQFHLKYVKKKKKKVQSLSHVFLQPHGLYIACQAPLSMQFSRQENWNGQPFPSPVDLPEPRIKPRSPALQILYHRSHHRYLLILVRINSLKLLCKMATYKCCKNFRLSQMSSLEQKQIYLY